jgi:hypothetical protein
MTSDTDAILDDLLIRWHSWASPYIPARGFNHRSLVCGDYITSRQYDAENGALDDALEARIMKQLDFEIGELIALYRIALSVQARALSLGWSVFTNPRLPEGKEERAKVIQDARAALLRRVMAAGVM